jgi:hypothetical protein
MKNFPRLVAITILIILIIPLIGTVAISLLPYSFDAALLQHQVIFSIIQFIVITFIIWNVVSFLNNKVFPFLFGFGSKNLYIARSLMCIFLSFFAFSSGEQAILHCERSTKSCELKRTGLWWSRSNPFPLHDLRGAYVQFNFSGETRRVALLTSRGDMEMTLLAYSPGLQQETAMQINTFVQKLNQESLQVYEDNRWMSWISGLVALFGGIFFARVALELCGQETQ